MVQGHTCLLRLSNMNYPNTGGTQFGWPSWNLPVLQWAKRQAAITGTVHSAFGLKTSNGVVVTRVVDGLPADKAGMRTGDIILKINKQPVLNAASMRNAIGLLRIDQRVKIEVLRNGNRLQLTAIVTEPIQARMPAGKIHSRLRGATLGEMPEGLEQTGIVIRDDRMPDPAPWDPAP